MIPLFAQLDKLPDNYLVWWVIAFGGLALIVQTVLNVADRFRAKKASAMIIAPDPLRVTQVADLATRKEVEAMGARLEADINDVRRSIDQKDNTAREENGKLHHRIDEVVERLSETKGLLSGVKDNTDKLLAKLLK
jgi:hypothetical protein